MLEGGLRTQEGELRTQEEPCTFGWEGGEHIAVEGTAVEGTAAEGTAVEGIVGEAEGRAGCRGGEARRNGRTALCWSPMREH
jgi:hypothetical protein